MGAVTVITVIIVELVPCIMSFESTTGSAWGVGIVNDPCRLSLLLPLPPFPLPVPLLLLVLPALLVVDKNENWRLIVWNMAGKPRGRGTGKKRKMTISYKRYDDSDNSNHNK